eukprot:gnl/Chilomastix_cuspidata/8442.p3 GENE.gnl/Chilomastix_cuspidata/8442~~gnl/Chilomastix_cuspidata/8442.p3  ORF type:complete len:158 (+),score=17.76 gnl/Chilomastix_cuspidata/8442:1510-1983(+)
MEVFLKLTLGSDDYQVMLKELQVDILNGRYLHADFLTITNDQVLDFRVPVEIVGDEKCPGTEDGGLLQILRRELDIRCTVQNIPESIKVDVSSLGLGESIHIDEIDLGENLEVFTDVNFTVVTIVAPAVEEGEGDEEETEGSEASAEAAEEEESSEE